jgi:hypothetical protein
MSSDMPPEVRQSTMPGEIDKKMADFLSAIFLSSLKKL